MAFSNHPLQILTIIILHLLTIQTHSSPTQPPTQLTNATAPVPASVVCESTQYPSYCKSILQSHSPTSNVYDYGRFSFKRSISQATKFLGLVNTYLSRTRKLRLTPYTVRALQDCQYLAQANLDFLTTSFTAVNTTENKTLPLMTAEDVQTFLSGILTNQDTCLDEIRSAASAYGISPPLLNDTKLYSVALSLFTKAWIPVKVKRVRLRHGRVLESVIGGDVHINQSVTVRQDGSGDFSSISAAIAAAPSRTQASDGYYVIYVTAGIYEEYVSIARKKRYIMMIGDGIDQTIITGNRSVADNYTTFQSATFAVTGPGFVGINMTIQNTAGAINHQAVALRNDADLSAFYGCSFEGYQDTLYAHSLRQFYRDCDIYGTVDFIFGNANVVFQNCNIYPRLPLENEFNAITAQGRTDPNQNTGISIENCTIRATDDLANSNYTVRTYLGRPWKQYSRTVYMQSFMDDLIDPAGWNEWDGNFALDTLYYGEYDNSGPGSNVSQRVNWAGYHVMNASDASNFTVSTFVFGDEWLPQTGVPYASGLL